MKTVIQHQHGHIASSPVADFCDPLDLFDHRLTQLGIEIVELSGIRPRSEVGIASIGNHFSAASGIVSNKKIAGVFAILR